MEADICNNCGEGYFSVKMSKFISRKVNEALENSKEEEVVRV